ncbi:MAG TPA: energy transducer TonB, partial [Bryobacteraceae bacterium]|nr:energy transducer TonB [Bryobacteraceae bacterium]
QVAKEPQVAGNVVNIGNPSPLKAPYPLVTVLPPVTMLPRTGYIIVHASLDAQGRLTDLEVLRAPNPRMKDLVLAELAKWQFRPAVRDGAPVAVEVLLAIPPQEV